MADIFAYTACLILILLGLFQLALILGAPIGAYAWGGNHRVLPARLRIGSAVSIVLYSMFAAIILEKAGAIAVIDSAAVINVCIWILTVYFFIGVFLNGISRSKPEQAVMTPVALTLAVLCLLIALA